ncbi:hypothetical protein Q5P01_000766 [Channa striata]|uniref:Uncharacterized protein n=1 Tax=Channa striata TaxID=64152 RepID=A0AA88IGF9_CHASR|nr:hypothetical protein Q5P01_000766 [Channa striata]
MTRATLRTTRRRRQVRQPSEQAAGRAVCAAGSGGALGARLGAAQDKGGGGAPAGRAQRATGRRGRRRRPRARRGATDADGAPAREAQATERAGRVSLRGEGEREPPPDPPRHPGGFDEACPEAGASTGVASTGPRAPWEDRWGRRARRSRYRSFGLGGTQRGLQGPPRVALPAMEADPQAGGTAHPNTSARPAGGGRKLGF